jgi:hypothetical protein
LAKFQTVKLKNKITIGLTDKKEFFDSAVHPTAKKMFFFSHFLLLNIFKLNFSRAALCIGNLLLTFGRVWK